MAVGTVHREKRTHDFLESWAGLLGFSAEVNVGTNGGTPWPRSSTIPPRSNTKLVTSYAYDEAGDLVETTDPSGQVVKKSYDQAGRPIETIENWVEHAASSSSSSSSGSEPDCCCSIRARCGRCGSCWVSTSRR